MNRVQFVSYKGKMILHLDFSGCKLAELSEAIGKAKQVISSKPANSILVLTDVTDAEMSRGTSDLMKDFGVHNKPYVAASAVVGVTGLRKIVYDAVVRISGRQIATFGTVEQAKDWLATQ